jgi:hypothetical protein
MPSRRVCFHTASGDAEGSFKENKRAIGKNRGRRWRQMARFLGILLLVKQTVFLPVNNVWTKVNSFCWKSSGSVPTFSTSLAVSSHEERSVQYGQQPENN